MLKTDAVKHFGSASALARALGIALPSVSEWGDIIPEGRAYQLQVITAGALRVDPSWYKKKEARQDAT